jgi:RNA polymerase sigma-70 factor (ECF subfamily)
MNDPYRTLMEQSAKGDARAFGDLTRLIGQRMFALAYRLMGNNAAAAEDAVQDALIKLWMNAPRWQPTGTVLSYALTVVHHCCMDLHRKHKVTSELQDTVCDGAELVVDRMVENEQRVLLMAGIDRLPERQKTAVLLSYFSNESNRKIGEAMNISEGAVESLLVRARKTLARDLPSELATNFVQRIG